MQSPTLINVKIKYLRGKGFESFAQWQNKPDSLYIGRNMNFYVQGALQSVWHNPFTLKQYSIEESLQKYEEKIRNSDLYDRLHELNGKELGCWCQGEHACHGDILIKLFNEKYNANKPKIIIKLKN